MDKRAALCYTESDCLNFMCTRGMTALVMPRVFLLSIGVANRAVIPAQAGIQRRRRNRSHSPDEMSQLKT